MHEPLEQSVPTRPDGEEIDRSAEACELLGRGAAHRVRLDAFERIDPLTCRL